MIRVLVDSAADYPLEELNAKGIELVPLTITLNDTTSYKDELELSREKLYQLLTQDGNRLKTSQPSPQDFVEKFEAIKEAGDEVICIMLSSALSGTYQSAQLAKDIVDYDKIYVIDSLSATIAVKIMADYAQKLIAEGKTAPEVVEAVESLKGRFRIKAVVDTLKYLYLGGRVSKTTAVIADAVTIKPGITLSLDGKVDVDSKYLGISRALKDVVKYVKNNEKDPAFPFYLIYSSNNENAAKLEKSLNDLGIYADGTYELGATLGVHVGPGAFGVIYVGK